MNTRRHIKNLLFMFLCMNTGLLYAVPPRLPDSLITPASPDYAHPGVYEWYITGGNYRKEWSVPVKMKVFDIKKVKGGLRIVRLGGGMQTQSLRLADKAGRHWVLRTVDKDLQGLLPAPLQRTIANDMLQSFVTAAHPYAPLVVSALAKDLGINAPHPELYVVPGDTALGEYRTRFAGKVCFLEELYPVYKGGRGMNMEHALDSLRMNAHTMVAQEDVLKARLLDMLIADWDRHPAQWRWEAVSTANGQILYPIPVDRDQAFFYSDGLLIKLAGLFGMPQLVGFRNDVCGMGKLNHKSGDFDHTFLNALSRKDWQRIASDVVRSLTDDAMHKAVMKLPPEVYAISGEMIEEKLRNRRDGLQDEAMNYYKIISKDVYISGTNAPERITIGKQGELLVITVLDSRKYKVFERSFLKGETRNIYLAGFQSNDHFQTPNDINAGINILRVQHSYEYDLKARMLYRMLSRK